MADMLTIYRRHAATCPFRGQGNNYARCRCVVYVQGVLNGVPVRQSLKTRDWRIGQVKARDMEAEGKARKNIGAVTVAAACAAVQDDARARGLSQATLKKYRVLSDQLTAFCAENGIRTIRQLDLAAARRFRASWSDAPLSASKKLERFRTFCAHFVSHGWMDQNVAKLLKAPIVHSTPTLPFTGREFDALVAAVDSLPLLDPSARSRTLALLYVLRYTGLRISDAVSLTPAHVKDNAITLRMAKTKEPVTIPIPDGLAEMLKRIKRPSGYYFSTGSKMETVTGFWRRRFARLAKLAGVKNAHPHRLRDTFAVDLLSRGVSIEDVSILLGHSSVRITERHYAPWVAERRKRLESIIREANQGVQFGTKDVH